VDVPGIYVLLRFLASVTRFGQDFQIKRFELFFFGLGYGLVNVGNMNPFTVCFIGTEPAVKIPKIDFGGQRLSTLSLQVFFNFMFDGFNQPWHLDLWMGQLESFFHNDNSAGLTLPP